MFMGTKNVWNLNIRNVPSDLVKLCSLEADQLDMSLREFVIATLNRAVLAKPEESTSNIGSKLR